MDVDRERAFFRRALIVASVALAWVFVLAVLWRAIDVVLLVFGAIILARFLHGLATAISRRTGLGFRWSMLITVPLFFSVLIGGVGFLVYEVGRYTADSAEEVSEVGESVDRWAARRPWARTLIRNMPDAEQLLAGAWGSMGAVGRAFGLAAAAIAGALIMSAIAIFLSINPGLYLNGAIRLLPVAGRARAREVAFALSETLWWWTLARLTSMSIIGVFSAVGLWLMGVPMAIPLGVLAGLLTFIPNLGPTLALAPPVILALEQGLSVALGVVAFYLGLQFVESHFITPLIEQRAVHTPPALVISTEILLGVLAGALGLALATPLLAMSMVLVNELYLRDVLEKDPSDEP